MAIIRGTLLLAVCWVLLFTWTEPVPATESFDTEVAETQLRRWAEEEQQALEKSIPMFRYPQLDTYVANIANRLWQQVDTDLPPIQVRIVEDPRLNALAYPNGIVYLTTGLVAHTQNEDQLAIIIAHEMSHYVLRHSLSAFDHLQYSSGPVFVGCHL